MKATLAAAVLILAAATASAAIDAYMTFVTLPQPVRLGDGSVLPAGKYDVKIDYKGFGGSAEFLFLQGGVLKGRTPAEARGFVSQAPTGAGKTVSDESPKETADKTVKLDPAAQKGVQGNFPKMETSDGAAAFSWSAQGFHAGAPGKVSMGDRGKLKISFDSANSAAGFSALLPAVQK